MNSSTSNSKARASGARKTAAILLLLALFFGGAEVGARKYARRRQNDLSDPTDPTSIGARATRLMQQKGRKIVFVGNSVVQQGIDLALFERLAGNLAGNSAPLHTTMAAATGALGKDWYWMLEHGFWQPKRQPDLFVVLFFSDMLQDTPREDQDRGRLAQFFTTPRDWPAVFAVDAPTLGQRSDFLFSYASMLFAQRAVTRGKLLKAVAPGYENCVVQLNATEQKQSDQQKLAPKTSHLKPPISYRALQRLLARARQTRSKLCFIAYPTNGKKFAYTVPPQVIEMIRGAGMTYIDLSHVPELTPDKYRDSLHVNKLGMPVFTRRLAPALSPLLVEK